MEQADREGSRGKNTFLYQLHRLILLSSQRCQDPTCSAGASPSGRLLPSGMADSGLSVPVGRVGKRSLV